MLKMDSSFPVPQDDKILNLSTDHAIKIAIPPTPILQQKLRRCRVYEAKCACYHPRIIRFELSPDIFYNKLLNLIRSGNGLFTLNLEGFCN